MSPLDFDNIRNSGYVVHGFVYQNANLFWCRLSVKQSRDKHVCLSFMIEVTFHFIVLNNHVGCQAWQKLFCGYLLVDYIVSSRFLLFSPSYTKWRCGHALALERVIGTVKIE